MSRKITLLVVLCLLCSLLLTGCSSLKQALPFLSRQGSGAEAVTVPSVAPADPASASQASAEFSDASAASGKSFRDMQPVLGDFYRVDSDPGAAINIEIEWDHLPGAAGYETDFIEFTAEGSYRSIAETNQSCFTAGDSKPASLMVRVRAFADSNGTREYSQWSNTKKANLNGGSFVLSEDDWRTVPIGPGAAAAAPESVPQYILPGSDSYYISDADLDKLTWRECCLARNEIYARHGRIFKTPEIAAYFNSMSWYNGTIPGDTFDKQQEKYLNQYEKANITTISKYESKTYGKSFY